MTQFERLTLKLLLVLVRNNLGYSYTGRIKNPDHDTIKEVEDILGYHEPK